MTGMYLSCRLRSKLLPSLLQLERARCAVQLFCGTLTYIFWGSRNLHPAKVTSSIQPSYYHLQPTLLLIVLSLLQARGERFTEWAAVNGAPLRAAAGASTAGAADATAAGPSAAAAAPGAPTLVGLTALNYAPPFELGLTDAVRAP